MAYYTGNKLCAGCGKSAADSPRSRADEVCRDCQKLLKLGKGVRETSASFSRVQLTKYSIKGLYVTDLSKKGYENPSRREGIAYVSNYGSPMGQQGSSHHLLDALEAVVKSLDEGAKENYDYKILMEESFPDIYSIQTPTALAIVDLLDAIRLYGDRRETEGYENGQSLLLRLCDGSLSIDEFNKRSVGNTRKT